MNVNNTSINWVAAFNRLFELINQGGDLYFGGSKFLNVVREVNYSVPSYNQYIEERRNSDKSTSRRDYYYDLVMEQNETDRKALFDNILSIIEPLEPQKVAEIKQIIGTSNAQNLVNRVQIPQELWNSDRLVEYIERMDTSIESANYELTLTLAYTCLEGFYKSFIREKIPAQIGLDELNPMSVQIRNYIKGQLNTNGIAYPEPVITLVSTITNAICNARNDFSDSHSGNRAEKWLAVYLRDNVNSLVRLLLNFM